MSANGSVTLAEPAVQSNFSLKFESATGLWSINDGTTRLRQSILPGQPFHMVDLSQTFVTGSLNEHGDSYPSGPLVWSCSMKNVTECYTKKVGGNLVNCSEQDIIVTTYDKRNQLQRTTLQYDNDARSWKGADNLIFSEFVSEKFLNTSYDVWLLSRGDQKLSISYGSPATGFHNQFILCQKSNSGFDCTAEFKLTSDTNH